MKITNVHLSNKWRKINKLSQKLIDDLKVYGDFIEKDYEKMGLTMTLTVKENGDIKLDLGADTVFGFLETHNILSIKHDCLGSVRCSPLIQKHNINIYAIYLLLDKYGYAGDSVVVNNNYVDMVEENLIQEAQAQLINLQLI